MTKSALIRLHDDIDAIRREAFAEGYAAAMQSVREFTVKQLPAATARSGLALAATPSIQPERPHPRRLRRGTNAKLIEAVLQSIAPRAVRPTEIRNVLRRERGVALAFTSIRHALGQLEARRVAEQVFQSKTWRYLGADDGRAGGNAV